VPAATAAQEVRIIGGRWKRTPLTVSAMPGLRPTPNRVRETLFNWLGQDLSGWRVLDAFAGSGALGFEAASRGAGPVQLLEREASLIRALRATQARLKADDVQIVQADALAWMRHQATPAFDLVLLDPPFEADVFVAALQAASGCVPMGGWIYLESPQGFAQVPPERGMEVAQSVDGLRLHRQGRAGAVHYHLFERVAAGQAVVRQGGGD